MKLRIIGGEHRGRVLESVRGIGTRPLLGQVREALFNILADSVPGGVVWDLFAGTGANGIEALSRGASEVCFVEKANQALAVLRGNLAMLGEDVEARSDVLKADAWRPPHSDPEDPEALTRPRVRDGLPAPDLIFLDPPYPIVREDPVRAAVRAMRFADWLAPGGALCFHFPDGVLDLHDFDAAYGVEVRNWGGCAIAILRAQDGRQPAPLEVDVEEEAPRIVEAMPEEEPRVERAPPTEPPDPAPEPPDPPDAGDTFGAGVR